jgi:hypothetical protein
MLRAFSGIITIGLLACIPTNPTLDDGLAEVNKRIKDDQSAVRASWSGITKATGIDWVGKQAGIGNFELCRKNLYAASLFIVREVGGTSSNDQLAVGVGMAGHIWGEKLMDGGDFSRKVLSTVVRPLAGSLTFTECKVFKKPGKLL